MGPGGRWRAARWVVGASVVLLLVGTFLVWWWSPGRPGPLPPAERTFDGASTELRHTVVVPTLDTPFPKGKSAVWCASFPLAWERLKTELAQGPVRVKGAEAVAQRLNRAEVSADDLPAGGWYTAAGFTGDGIRERIAQEMAKQFPASDLPALPGTNNLALAYGYLQAEARFTEPYLNNPDPVSFRPSVGRTRPVHAFGIPIKGPGGRRLREQVEILFVAHDLERGSAVAYALDLCKHSRPNQVVVARLERKQTLADTLADLEDKVNRFDAEHPAKSREDEHAFHRNDTLLVPEMHWRIRHRFSELEGKVLRNGGLRGLPLGAIQDITFRLDGNGAAVASGASIEVKRVPRRCHFDRPFLVYLKKRGAQRPFFVLWVDNAELLHRTD